MKSGKTARRFLKEQGLAMLGKAGARQWFLAAMVFVSIVALMLANAFPDSEELAVGKVATRDITAPFRVQNTYRTQLEQDRAARQAELEAIANDAYYIINPAAAQQAEERVAAIFAMIRESRQDLASVPELTLDQRLAIGERLGAEIVTERGLSVPVESLQAALALSDQDFATAQKTAISLATEMMAQERVSSETINLVQARVVERVGNINLPSGVRLVVSGVVQSVIQPNLVLDTRLVDEARAKARAAVEPVYVEQGQIIVRWGDVIDQEQMSILTELGMLRPQTDWRLVVGVVMAVGLLMSMLGVYLYQNEGKLLQNERLLSLLGLMIVVMVGLAKLATLIPFPGMGYLVPVALATMVITTLLNSHLAMVTAVFLALIMGMMGGDQGFKVAVVALVSGTTGVFSVSRISQRSDLTRAGLIVGGTALVTMLALGLLGSDAFLSRYSFLGLVNGILSAVGAIGLLPYLESVFGITSSIRLLELSNPNHPLLRKLLLEAPGTYHHSMMVGNLSEAAAEAIGADPLLTRVGSQYHDIGKTKRPYFFIENQFSGVNPHDKISPTLSTLIITSHVKDGVELARQHKLPQVLIDFIREHHGTDLVKYFYHRAKESGREVSESDFRYPGPKPHSRETAIVMLADAVEAAVRSMQRPTPGRVEGLVRKIIKERLNTGQLDESNLTLRDLDFIADAFVRVLTGMFHHRVEYPEGITKENGYGKEQGGSKEQSQGKERVETQDEAEEDEAPSEEQTHPTAEGKDAPL